MNSKVSKELRRMSASIPEEISTKLMTQQLSFPATLELLDKALEDKDITDKAKERVLLIKQSKMLEMKEWAVDKEVEKLLDRWWEDEIKKAQKEGRLPKPTKTEGTLKELVKKGKQYARKNKKGTQGEDGDRNS